MKNCFTQTCVAAFVVISIHSGGVFAAEPPNYEQHVKPVLRDHCLKCHNADDANADLDLSSFAALIEGGSAGAVVKAGRPASSLLYQAITHAEGVEAMPPEGPKIPAAKIEIIQEWIRGGLIPGKGGKSQLRSVSMAFKTTPGGQSPLPKDLPKIPLSKTVRPPIPQALATSPGAAAFAVSGHEQILLYGDSVNTATDEKTFGLLGVVPFAEGTIHDLKFSRSGSLLLAAGGRGAHSGRVVLFDVASGKRIAEIGDEVDSVLAADITTDHQTVAFGGPGKIVKLYRTQTGKLLHKIKKHTDWITAMSFSPNGEWLATGDRSGGIHVWESKGGAIVLSLSEHKVRITDLAWRIDNKILASAAEDGNVILWDMKDGWPAQNIAAHTKKAESRYRRETGVFSLDFARDGRLLTTGRDGMIRVWSADGKKSFETHASAMPLSGGFVANSPLVVTGHFDGKLQVTNLTSNTSTDFSTDAD